MEEGSHLLLFDSDKICLVNNMTTAFLTINILCNTTKSLEIKIAIQQRQ